MKSKRIFVALAFAALWLAGLACGGPPEASNPTPTYEPIPVSTEAIQSLKDKFSSLGVVSGEVTVSITESELTSYFAEQLAAQPDSAFSDPQVYLRDGKLKLYLTVTTESLAVKAQIILNPMIVDNRLQVSIESADFGPIPAPQNVLDSLTAVLNDKLLALASNLPNGVGLKNIVIADGQMTLTAIVN